MSPLLLRLRNRPSLPLPRKASPQTEEQAYQSLSDADKAIYDSARGKVAGAPAGSSPKLNPAEQAVLDKIKAQTSAPSAAPSGPAHVETPQKVQAAMSPAPRRSSASITTALLIPRTMGGAFGGANT